MNDKTTAVIVLLIVAVVCACSATLLYKNTTSMAVYEQLSNNKPPFLYTSRYYEGVTLCNQFVCPFEGYYGEGVPAEFAGFERLTGNMYCGCPDGKTFQARPDRIEVETY